MREPVSFWSYVVQTREAIEARLKRFDGVVPASRTRQLLPDLLRRLNEYDRGLSLEIERGEAGFSMVVTADGAIEDFPAARTLVAAAPPMPGWSVRALAPRREPGDSIQDGRLSLRVEGLRFAYRLANDRMVVVILADEGPFELGAQAHFLARRLVCDLLGEEDYALWMSDARLMRYEDWLAVTPGGRSWPIAELTQRFDTIFHPSAPPRGAMARFSATQSSALKLTA